MDEADRRKGSAGGHPEPCGRPDCFQRVWKDWETKHGGVHTPGDDHMGRHIHGPRGPRQDPKPPPRGDNRRAGRPNYKDYDRNKHRATQR